MIGRIVVALAIIGGVAALILWAGVRNTSETKTIDESFTKAQVGECFATPVAGENHLTSLACEDANALKLVAVGSLDSLAGPYPGAAALASEARVQCPEESTTYLAASEDAWDEDGGKRLLCFQKTQP